MSENIYKFNELRLSKELGNGIQELDDIECSLNFEDAHFYNLKPLYRRKLFAIASFLICGLLVATFITSNSSEGQYVNNLTLLISESQELESRLLKIQSGSTDGFNSLSVIKVFNDIKQIDYELEKIYNSVGELSIDKASDFWRQRIKKLNFALELLNSNTKPLYI